jgi:hypothetical protein
LRQRLQLVPKLHFGLLGGLAMFALGFSAAAPVLLTASLLLDGFGLLFHVCLSWGF